MPERIEPGVPIRSSGLRKRFGRTQALGDASIAVRPREVVAVSGPSGSGKSTLLHCLAGLVVPDAGEVWFDGQRLSDLDDESRTALRRAHIGFVMQFGHLVAELTVLQNTCVPLRLNGASRRAAEKTAWELLNRLGVGALGDRLPGQLSGGQQQRVAVARALVINPSVVLADEPTGALDRRNAAEVAELLIGAAREVGASVVIATHDVSLATAADRRITMTDGSTDGKSAAE